VIVLKEELAEKAQDVFGEARSSGLTDPDEK
jgi:hypothetical protein